jgi:hypothetical protein
MDMAMTFSINRDEEGTPRIEVPVSVADTLKAGDMLVADGVEQRVLALSSHSHAWNQQGPLFQWAYIDLEPTLPTETISTGRKMRLMHEVFRHTDGRTLVALYHTREMQQVEGETYFAPVYETTCRPATQREIEILAAFEQRTPEPYFGMKPWDPSLNDWTV